MGNIREIPVTELSQTADPGPLVRAEDSVVQAREAYGDIVMTVGLLQGQYNSVLPERMRRDIAQTIHELQTRLRVCHEHLEDAKCRIREARNA